MSGLKAQLEAAKEQLAGQLEVEKRLGAVTVERLVLAGEKQDQLAQKLAVATETIGQLQKQISDGETSNVAQTIEAVQSVIKDAATDNAALKGSLVTLLRFPEGTWRRTTVSKGEGPHGR
jgi:hypothetical protein